MTLRIGVAGVHGHGRGHVEEALRLEALGRANLIAVADPRGPGDVPEGVSWFDEAERMIDAADLDVVVLSTPIPTHARAARAAMLAGAHVLVEKPPVVDRTEHAMLCETSRSTGRAVQVGFQSLGSDGVSALADIVAGSDLGDLRHVFAVGLWSRSQQYWRRAAWSGRRVADGVRVADGAVTNPLAHALATALAAAGAESDGAAVSIDLDMYRSDEIATDDTSSGVVTLLGGLRVGFVLATSAARRLEPYVLVRGTRGHAVYHYTADLLHVFREGVAVPRTYAFGRASLLENLIDHAVLGVPLRVPVARTGAFTRVLDEVVSAPLPPRIPDTHVRTVHRGGETFRVVGGIEGLAEVCAWEGCTFSEAGAPWAVTRPH